RVHEPHARARGGRMSGRNDPPEPWLDLIDGYCSGLLDDEGHRRLESYLLASPEARRAFVAYFQMHTELEFAVRARNPASAARGPGPGRRLPRVRGGGGGGRARPPRRPFPPPERRRPPWATARPHVTLWSPVAAGVVFAVAGYAAAPRGRTPPRPPLDRPPPA